jgi:hypothetical protein
MVDLVVALEEWFLDNCDGDWEHSWGVSISTLDNPGWSVDINLEDTSLQRKTFHRLEVERNENDWMHCWVDQRVFKGRGGPKNLSEILRVFTEWSTS